MQDFYCRDLKPKMIGFAASKRFGIPPGTVVLVLPSEHDQGKVGAMWHSQTGEYLGRGEIISMLSQS